MLLYAKSNVHQAYTILLIRVQSEFLVIFEVGAESAEIDSERADISRFLCMV